MIIKKILTFVLSLTSIFLCLSCTAKQQVKIYDPGESIDSNLIYDSFNLDESINFIFCVDDLDHSYDFGELFTVYSIDIQYANGGVGIGLGFGNEMQFNIDYYININGENIANINDLVLDEGVEYNIIFSFDLSEITISEIESVRFSLSWKTIEIWVVSV